MFSSSRAVVALSPLLALSAFFVSTTVADCASFGIDFQDGGSYFINSLDTTDFTVVTEFEDCSGTANVILEAPNEDSWLCSDIATSPDDADQLSTCPISKSQMYSGTWTIVVLDNNGDDASFSAQRTFDLIVAPQQTVTYIPTVYITSEISPSTTTTSTFTESDTITLNPSTVTSKKTAKATKTIVPARVTKTKTSTISPARTITSTTRSKSIIISTHTATCSIPRRPSRPDPAPSHHALAIAQALLGVAATTSTSTTSSAAAVITSSKKKKFGKKDENVSREEIARRPAVARYLAGLEKRAPDVPTLTVTDTNTADWATSTTTITDPVTTLTAIVTEAQTFTVTPTPFTTYSGVTVVTVTAPTPTRTITRITRLTSTSTKTVVQRFTLTTTVTPAGVKATCSAKGGFVRF